MSNAIAFLTTIFPSNEPYLNDFFDSLERQTHSKFDVVIVNDGYGSIEKLKISYPGLRLINLPFSDTPAKNREYGINYCIDNGYDIIIFGDSDDYFDKKRVEISIGFLEEYDIVVNDLSLFDEGGKFNNLYISSRVDNNRVIGIDFIRDKNIFGLSNTALKTKILNKVTFDSDLIAVDWYLFSILLLNGCSAIFTSSTITFYRQHQLNTIGLSSTPININSVRRKHYGLLKKIDSSYNILYNDGVLAWNSAQEVRHEENVANAAIKNPLWWEQIKY